MAKRTILLCAGGTGGHLFPAQALAHVLVNRGYEVHLAADERVRRFADDFPATEIHEIRSATLGSKNPISVIRTMAVLFAGYRQSQSLLKKIKPVAVAGFGGYPTVPPVFAATRIGIPALVHEQNAVLGRANRLLAPGVKLVAMGFEAAADQAITNLEVTGNPVRPAVIDAAKNPYPVRKVSDPFNLLVFGGSQGAAYFSEVVPEACRLLPEKLASRLRIVQQARPEDLDGLRKAYLEIGIKAEVEIFFKDMPGRIAKSHLVMSRAGASTVSELAVIGRPAILIPYPHALDHDQAANAAAVKKAGGAQIIEQKNLTPKLLADQLVSALGDPKKLATAAKNAKKTGKPNAAAVLADCIEDIQESA